jgi:2-dehydro-3-deoxygluconokinase
MAASAQANPGRGRTVCFGELLMRLSAPGRERLLQSPRLDMHFGGAEANVAASLAILGHDSAVVSTLPGNAIGRACAGELRRHGVDTAGIVFGGGRMGLYFLSPGAMHRPSEVLYDRAGSAFARAPTDAYDWPHLLAGARWLHLSGIDLALGDTVAETALAAVRTARAAGVQISFDCNYRSNLWEGRTAQAPGLLRGMAAIGREHLSVDRQSICGRLAVGDAVLTTATHALDGVVDRIGSGDAFAAGILHGLLCDMDDAATLDFALAAACLKHSVPGDVNLMGEADVLAFLAQGGFEVKR